jgi:ornithine carbamoyltransferase
MKRDFLSLSDLGPGGIEPLLDVAKQLEQARRTPDHPKPLAGRSAALVFEKASTRTRVSLEVAVHELGGWPIVLTSQGSQMERGETLADTARVLDRMVDVITYRTFQRDRLLALARAAKVPVVNALTDDAHPLQLLADLYTVRAVRGRLAGLRYVWVGDGNNMARSWIEAARMLGLDLVLACPRGYEPPAEEVDLACRAGAKVTVVDDPRRACERADVISTDVWASMGQEDEQERRRRAFERFRVSRELVGCAAEDVVVLHCLPAHRGEEIDEEVMEGPRSFVWDQAAARLHTGKAVLWWVLGRT